MRCPECNCPLAPGDSACYCGWPHEHVTTPEAIKAAIMEALRGMIPFNPDDVRTKAWIDDEDPGLVHCEIAFPARTITIRLEEKQ